MQLLAKATSCHRKSICFDNWGQTQLCQLLMAKSVWSSLISKFLNRFNVYNLWVNPLCIMWEEGIQKSYSLLFCIMESRTIFLSFFGSGPKYVVSKTRELSYAKLTFVKKKSKLSKRPATINDMPGSYRLFSVIFLQGTFNRSQRKILI